MTTPSAPAVDPQLDLAVENNVVTAEYARDPVMVQVELPDLPRHWALLSGLLVDDKVLELWAYGIHERVGDEDAPSADLLCDLTPDGPVPRLVTGESLNAQERALNALADAFTPQLRNLRHVAVLLRSAHLNLLNFHGSSPLAEDKEIAEALLFLHHLYRDPDRGTRQVALAMWRAGIPVNDPATVLETARAASR